MISYKYNNNNNTYYCVMKTRINNKSNKLQQIKMTYSKINKG